MNVTPDPISYIDAIKLAKVRMDNDAARYQEAERNLETVGKLAMDSRRDHTKLWNEFRLALGYPEYV
jgi:hypothetical protein